MDRYVLNNISVQQSFNQSMTYFINAKAVLKDDNPNVKNNILVIMTCIIDLVQIYRILEINLKDIIEELLMLYLFKMITYTLIAEICK